MRRSASEEVADAIRACMFGRDLAPGDRLGREEDLAQRFGVSRPTLREALRLLSSAHLIRATKGPGGGIFVAATPEQGIGLSVTDSVASMLSADSIDLDELIETRMLLEIPLAGLAAQRATEEDVARAARDPRRGGRVAQGDSLPRARHAAARDDRRDRRQPAGARVHRVGRPGAAAAAARADRARRSSTRWSSSSTATSCARSSAATRARPSGRCASTSSTSTTSSARCARAEER